MRALALVAAILVGQCLPAYIEAREGPKTKEMSFPEYQRRVTSIDIRRHTVSLPQLKNLLDKQNAYVLDLRSKEEFDRGHLKHALHLGADITEKRLQELVPNKKATIVIYCEATLFPFTRRMPLTFIALPQLIELGYPNALVLNQLSGEASKRLMQSSLWQMISDKQ